MSGFAKPISGQDEIGSRSRAPHYFWDAPGGSRVIMAAQVAGRIDQEVMKAYRALPRRGLEIGGILLGRVLQQDPLEVLVQDFEPVPCEHRYGPSFILSDADRARLDEILANPGSWPEYTVVGYFRSFTGREIELDAADRDLMERHFREPEHVILALQPVSATQCLGEWFVRRDAEDRAKPAGVPLPFGEGPAADFEPPAIAPREESPEPAAPVLSAEHDGVAPAFEPAMPVLVAELEPEPEPEPPPRPTLAPPRVAPRRPDPEPERAATPRRWPWVLAMAAAIAGFAIVHRWSATSVTHPLSSPQLAAHRTASGIELTWDGAALARQQATGGLLAVSDGEAKSQIELDAAAVARGRLAYKPSGNDLYFHLSVFGPEKQWTAASFHMPRQEPTPDAPVQEPEPVAPAAAAAQRTDEPELRAGAKPEPKPPAPAPAPRATPEPAVPPVVLHQVQPGVSDSVRARLRTPVTVPVIVQIDASGKVSRASAQGSGDGLYSYLAERARLAARFWRFQPARAKNGRPVPSSKTVFIKFGN